MRRTLITTFLIWRLATSISLYAQGGGGAQIPYTEYIITYVNTSFLITGETLYYSVYCFKDEKFEPSTLSRVAYSELIGEDGKSILQEKIILINGQGAGDFFLPSTLPTGNYTLIVYTKWMRNFALEKFFQKQIAIVNPYLRSSILESRLKNDRPYFSRWALFKKTNEVELVVIKKEYAKREKVVVTIKNNDSKESCKISLNVRHFDKNVDSIYSPSQYTSLDTTYRNKHSDTQVKKKFVSLLPDLRGETIAGIARESDTHLPIANTDIYLSAPIEPFFFQVSQTDSSGRFYFSTKNIQTPGGIQFQMGWPSETKPFDIILDDEFVNDHEKFTPAPLSIHPSIRKYIEQRNIYSQIENAYFTIKSDSLINLIQSPFFKRADKVYKLDDFTRFPTMEDIFREYIYEVVVSKHEGRFVIQVTNQNNKDLPFPGSPLVVVDGVRVLNTETLMNYNPLLIKSISISTRQFVFAGILFDGILSVTTYTGDAKDLPISRISKKHTPTRLAKKLYWPTYDNIENLNRIPDYRVQLFWDPIISIEPNQTVTREFYTSDIDGEFLIEVKGFNSKGQEVEVRNLIKVQK